MTFRQALLWISFALSFVITLIAPIMVPYIRLFPFAPFITLAILSFDVPLLLFVGAGCGCLVDLFSPGSAFGLHALSYTLITLITCRYRKYFSIEKPQALMLFCAYISLLYTLMTFLFSAFTGDPLPLTGSVFFTNFILMPLLDGLVSFCLCFYPIALYIYIKCSEEHPLLLQFLLRFGQKMLKKKS